MLLQELVEDASSVIMLTTVFAWSCGVSGECVKALKLRRALLASFLIRSSQHHNTFNSDSEALLSFRSVFTSTAGAFSASHVRWLTGRSR